MKHLKNKLFLCISLFTIILLTIALFVSTPAQAAAAPYTVSQSIPFLADVFIPCAAGGAGELVVLSGTLHDLYSITLTPNGNYRATYADNPQGVTGTGLTTGDKYQATGITRGSFSGAVGYEETYVNNFYIIGQSTTNNYMVHENYHVTVNANRTLTAYADNFSVTCK